MFLLPPLPIIEAANKIDLTNCKSNFYLIIKINFNMNFKKFNYLFFAGLLATSVFSLASCDKDDDSKPAPTITLSDNDFTGKIGETATVTATVVAPEGLKSLTITKYLGTTVDATYGTNGSKTVTHESHTETYELNEEGLDTPVRFKFEATDNKDQVSSADFIITTEASTSYLLVKYNWQWKSKVGQATSTEPGPSEQILECEKDNIYTFNADGTYSLDFGAMTGSGGGTCDFDALVVTNTWELNQDETELTIFASNIFDPTPVPTVHKITSASNTSIKSTSTIDLTAFPDGIESDWTFEWTAKPK